MNKFSKSYISHLPVHLQTRIGINFNKAIQIIRENTTEMQHISFKQYI